MSTIKLNTDCIVAQSILCFGKLHVASNAWLLQENLSRLAANQSAHTIVVIK